MSFLLEKEYPMLSHPDYFKKEIHLSLEKAKEIGFENPRELSMQRAHWKLADGYSISVIFGYGSYGFDRGLFEMALMKDGHLDAEPRGHLTEDEVEKILQEFQEKHGVKK